MDKVLRKIGEQFEFLGIGQIEVHEAVTPESCDGCLFADCEICNDDHLREDILGSCDKTNRGDGNDIIFIKPNSNPIIDLSISEHSLVHRLALKLVEADLEGIASGIKDKTVEDAEYAGAAYVKFAKGFYDELRSTDPVTSTMLEDKKKK